MDTITAVQQLAAPWLDGVMLVITYLGDAETYIALLVVVYLAINPEVGRRLGVYLLLSATANAQFKEIFATPRPFVLAPEVARGEMAVGTAPGASFPSGHAQMSATFWGYLALQVRRPWFWLLALLLIALVSLSRVYLGVHFPVDIWGGLAIAVGVLALALLADRYLVPVLARWPVWLLVTLGLLVPLALQLLLPPANMFLGGLAALLTAPLLLIHRVPRTVGRRITVATLGLLLVAATWVGLEQLPETVRDHPFGEFAQYLVLGYVGLALVPYLARVTGLAPGPVDSGPDTH